MEEARKALKAYLDLWKKQKYKRMQKACTETYRHNYKSPSFLIARFPYALGKYRVQSVKEVTPMIVDAIVTCKYNGKNMTLYFRLMKEIAAYVPTEAGTWGVNPISIREIVNAESA